MGGGTQAQEWYVYLKALENYNREFDTRCEDVRVRIRLFPSKS